MKKKSPPDWADRFLEWYCSDYYLEEVQGDLHEWYYKELQRIGPRAAGFRYAVAIIRYFRLFRLKPVQKLINNPNYLSMKSIIKITYRNLRRDKISGLIRVGNLSLGVIVFLLALVYSKYELNYDRFHEKGDRIFRVGMSFGGNPWAATPLGMGAFVQDNVPEVKRMTRFAPIRNTWVKFGENQFYEKGGFSADSSIFEMFTYTFIQGDPKTALIDPRSIVLTERIARKYFGNENPMGKRLELSIDQDREGNIEPRIVTGIIEDIPQQSHLQFDFICSIYTFDADFLRKWRNFWVYTYVELEEGSDPDNTKSITKEEFVSLRSLSKDEAAQLEILMTPVERIHLYTNHEKEYADNGNILYIYILFSIGVFILIVSCINYVNLTIIKGLDRAREVGLRKTVGASRHQLVMQFLGENMVLLSLAGLICLIALVILAPVFQRFSGLDLPLNFIYDPAIIFPLVAILLTLELISGLYPAFVLTKFRPVDIIKSGTQTVPMRKIGLTRKVLIIIQFSLSVILVIGSIVVFNQLRFIQRQDLGFEKDQIILIKLNQSVRGKFKAFENEMLQIQGVRSVSTSSSVPGYRIMLEDVIEIGAPDEYGSRLLFADETFLDTYEIDLLEGRHFDGTIKRGENEFMLNQKAAEMVFGDKHPLNNEITIAGDTGLVVGIVKDFNFQTLHSEVEPLTISNLPIALFGYASIKFEAKSAKEILEAIDVNGRKIYPELPPLETEFLDNRFELLYMAENKLQNIVWIFCMITILLTISGVFGVATYNAHKRAKEIAIRKVLGGDLLGLLQQLSREYLYLLGFSLLIGLPGAFYLSKWWLQDFAYRISLDPPTFLISALVMIIIILVSSGFVTFRAATANPVEALKNE